MTDDSPSPTPRDSSSLHCRILAAVSLIEEALCRGVSNSPWRSGGHPGLAILTEGGYGGELRLVLGPAGVGKTSLAASLISGMLKQEQVDPIAWFSLQESAAQAALRLLCVAARMPLNRVVAGDVSTRHNLEILTKAANALSKQPVFIDEVSPMAVVELRSRCLKWAEKSRLQLIVIDPIEALLDEDGNHWGCSPQASEDITSILRVMTRELRMPVLCFATAPSEPAEASPVPSLASLPESLAPIFEEADRVLYLKTPKTHAGEGVVISSLHVLKQDEECMSAITPMLFRSDLLLFESVE
jgi:hypothetical protein